MSDPLPGLRDLIAEDWIANGRDWTKPGFRALAVYRFGVWRLGVNNKLLRAPLTLLYRFLFRRVRNGYGIEFPYSIKAGRRIVIEHQGAIVVHGNVEMGDDCVIRQGVTIGNRYSDRPFEAPKLGRGVNVGAGAKILGGITIGDGAVVGANAVVLNNVDPHSCVVGIPAKPVSRRHQNDLAI
jgi:serine O-acetyltransferase